VIPDTEHRDFAKNAQEVMKRNYFMGSSKDMLE
jgi:hypothetical protein